MIDVNAQDGPPSVELEPAADSNSLYLFFGGLAAGIAMPPFEFYNASRIVHHNKMFVRDFSRSWYHAGLAGVTRDIDSTVRYLRSQIARIQPQRTVFVGNSMGGYAAMLFAALLDAPAEVVAFAPQTFISPWLRWRHRDRRWREHIRRMWRQRLPRRRYWDLRPLLLRASGLDVSIYVSRNDRLDAIHAMRVAHVPGVRVHAFDYGYHDIVRQLRDEGRLAAIMAGSYVPEH